MKQLRFASKIVIVYFLFVFFIDFLHIQVFLRKVFRFLGRNLPTYTIEQPITTADDPVVRPPIPPEAGG